MWINTNKGNCGMERAAATKNDECGFSAVHRAMNLTEALQTAQAALIAFADDDEGPTKYRDQCRESADALARLEKELPKLLDITRRIGMPCKDPDIGTVLACYSRELRDLLARLDPPEAEKEERE
jgi:hypothetical protein